MDLLPVVLFYPRVLLGAVYLPAVPYPAALFDTEFKFGIRLLELAGGSFEPLSWTSTALILFDLLLFNSEEAFVRIIF